MAALFIRARSAYARTLARIRKRGLKAQQTRSKTPHESEFRLLGPLEICSRGKSVPLGGQKQRALLALLLLHANEVVSRDRLIDGVWGESPPSTIASVLNVYLSKLRKLLATCGSEAALLTHPHGYMLRIDPEQLDLNRFERLVDEGREALGAGKFEEAAARVGEALTLWRGPPLSDLADAPFATSTIGRLGELRFCALENRIEAGLALGRHSDLVPELEALVAEHPLRERCRAQLMIALYRTGRQTEALQSYREARRLLAEDVGIDPGPELQRLEKAILIQDPSLEPPVAGSLGSRASAQRRLRRPAFLTAALASVAAAVVVPILALGRGDVGRPDSEGRTGTILAPRNDVAIVQPETNKVVAHIPVGSNPTLIREGDGSVWVADRDDQTVTQIDPESRRVVRTIGIGFRPDDLAAGYGAVWAVNKEEGALVKVGSGEIRDRFERRGFAGFGRMAVDDEAVWLSGGKRLIRVDAATGRVVKRAEVPVHLDGVAVGAGAMWAVSGSAATVLRIDLRTAGVLDTISLPTRRGGLSSAPLEIAADTRFVWVLDGSTGTVTKIDPELGRIVATFTLGTGRGSARLTAGEGAAWVSNTQDGTVIRIDAETDAITALSVTADSSPKDIAVAAGLVWLTVDEG